MKYFKIYFELFILLFFISCNNQHPITIEKIQPIDSFVVNYTNFDDAFQARMTGDGKTIVSHLIGDNTLSFYSKIKDKLYDSMFTSPDISNIEWGWAFLKLEHDSLHLLGKRELLILDKNSYKGRKLIASEPMKFLDNNFRLLSQIFNPSLILNDTLVTAFYFGAKNRTNDLIANLEIFLKEPPISMYVLVGDSLKFLRGIFKAPEKELFRSQNNLKYSCVSGSKYSLVYGCLDTIYTYDFNTGVTDKINIKNPFYKRNNEIDWSNVDQSYVSKYNVENFSYSGFYFNPSTKNYTLFFEAPYLDKEKIPLDNKMYAMVLDQEFKIKHLYDLGRKYLGFYAMLEVPNKGIAFLLKPKQSNEKTTYYIFNF